MSEISGLELLATVLVVFKPILKEACDKPDYFLVDVILRGFAVRLLEQRVEMVLNIGLIELDVLLPGILDRNEVYALVQGCGSLGFPSDLSPGLEPLGLLEPL